MPPAWLTGLSWFALAVAFASTAWIASGIFGRGFRQPMMIIEAVWPVTGLYFGPAAAAADPGLGPPGQQALAGAARRPAGQARLRDHRLAGQHLADRRRDQGSHVTGTAAGQDPRRPAAWHPVFVSEKTLLRARAGGSGDDAA
jgi:hypothetical protein